MSNETRAFDGDSGASTDGRALGPYHRHVARSCLATICAQLAVLRNAYESAEQNQEQFELLPTLLCERFDPNFYRSDGIFLRATGEPYAAGVRRLLFDQLRADKHFIAHTLQVTKKELLQSAGAYASLESTVRTLRENRRDEHEFVLEYARNVLTLRRLQAHERQLRTRIEHETIQPPLFDVSSDVFCALFV